MLPSTVWIDWARIVFMAQVLRNVDLPEALDPVKRTPSFASMVLATAPSIRGWIRSFAT